MSVLSVMGAMMGAMMGAIATVAKMAGTSVMMIEKVYGHFKSEHFQDALRKLEAFEQQSEQRKKSA